MDKDWQDSVDRKLRGLEKWQQEFTMESAVQEKQLTGMQLAIGELRHMVQSSLAEFRQELGANTKATNDIKNNTDDLVDFTRSVKWVAKLSQPLSWIVGLGAACASLYYAMKGGPK